MELNLEQQQAVAAGPGAWLCKATAGAGKTTVLVERVRRLLAEGASPDEILALTFTRSAAKNMQERLKLNIPTTEKYGFRNFHSFGLRVILNESRYLPFPISPEPLPEGPQGSRILGRAMKKFGVRGPDFKAVRSYISTMKQRRWSPEAARADVGLFGDTAYADIYAEYERGMREARYLDEDDLILWSVFLLEIPQVRVRYQFKWVLCDESQDTDDNQFRILQLVSEANKNVFIVGDENQALYSFRGAHPENLSNIRTWFPDAQIIILPENYRSSANIVRYSQKHAPTDTELTRAMRTANPEGAPIDFRLFATPETEAESALVSAEKLPGTSAILARTNSQIAVVEDICTEHKVPFRLLGKCGFWEQPEVKSVVSLTGFILSGNPANGFQQERVHAGGIVSTSKADWAVKEIIRLANLDEIYAHDDYAAEANYALRNLRSLEKKAERFATLREFKSYTARASAAARNNKKGVTLGTVHAAKGLEWDNVFVIGVQQDLLPHVNGEDKDERRVFYVAISRPAKYLRISFCGAPSPYIKPDLTPEIITKMQECGRRVEVLEAQLQLIHTKDSVLPFRRPSVSLDYDITRLEMLSKGVKWPIFT